LHYELLLEFFAFRGEKHLKIISVDGLSMRCKFLYQRMRSYGSLFTTLSEKVHNMLTKLYILIRIEKFISFPILVHIDPLKVLLQDTDYGTDEK